MIRWQYIGELLILVSFKKMHSIKKRNTSDLTTFLAEKQPIGVKWALKTKYKADGEIDCFKATYDTKGCKQKTCIDCFEFFALVARLDTIRIVICFTAQSAWLIYQIDVKSAFLNRVLEEEVYVDQSDGYVVKGQESKVYRLKKASYELKQAPQAWYTRICTYFVEHGFQRCSYEYILLLVYLP